MKKASEAVHKAGYSQSEAKLKRMAIDNKHVVEITTYSFGIAEGKNEDCELKIGNFFLLRATADNRSCHLLGLMCMED